MRLCSEAGPRAANCIASPGHAYYSCCISLAYRVQDHCSTPISSSLLLLLSLLSLHTCSGFSSSSSLPLPLDLLHPGKEQFFVRRQMTFAQPPPRRVKDANLDVREGSVLVMVHIVLSSVLAGIPKHCSGVCSPFVHCVHHANRSDHPLLCSPHSRASRRKDGSDQNRKGVQA